MWRSAAWLVLAACSVGNSTLHIYPDPTDPTLKFDKIELFFVTQAAPVTDVTKVPHTTNTIDTPISSPATLWLRDYHGGEDPPDLWTGSARSMIDLGIPNRVGVGRYIGVVASAIDNEGVEAPVAFGQVTQFSNDGAVTYDVALTSIRENPPVGSVVPTSLSGLHWLSPCKTPNTDSCADETPVIDAPVQIAGSPGDTFLVHARIRGVMEVNAIPTGNVIGDLTTGTPSGAANAFELVVSNTVYTINGATHDGRIQPWDYTVTFSVTAGDSVSFAVVQASTAAQYANFDTNSVPFQLPGVLTMPAPYPGQFARLDVLDVTRISTDNVTTWPTGVDVWAPHGSEQTCLRATIGGVTNFVVTSGDLDCDSFVDSADCNPLRYCDPTVPSAGCSSACNAKVMGQCMSGTCIDSYGATDTRCEVDPDKPSYCLACESSCDYGSSLDGRQATFDCIDMQAASGMPLADDLCNYGVLGNSACPTAIVMSFASDCYEAVVLSSDAGFPVTAGVAAVSPCTVNLFPEASAAFTPTIHYVMLGLETMAGSFDTVVVQLVPSMFSSTLQCTTLPACASSPNVHTCSN